MGSLSNLYISQSYQSLIHLATNNTASAALIGLEDGLGNSIGVSVNTAGNLYLSGTFSASLQEGYLYVGNASGRSIAFPTSSLVSNVNTSSLVTTSSFNTYTASTDIRLSNIELTTASVLISISNINQYTQSNDAKWLDLGNKSGSWITESETGSFARYDVSNPWSADQTFTNITAFSASFQYVKTVFETASVIYSSGSNQFGDAANDIQTLYGSTRIVNELTASGLNYPTADNGELSFIQSDGAGNLSLQYVKTLYQNIRNRETSSIVLGTPLFVSGATGDNADVYIAQAGNPLRYPATLIAGDATLAASATGKGIVSGEIKGPDTSAYTPGTIIYLGALGGWTATRPTGSATQVQILGVVTKQGSNGEGLVMNQLGTELPNIQEGYAWVGNANGTPTAVATSSFFDNQVSSASFNSYTASNDSKVNQLIAATGSYVTEGESGSFLITASFDNGTRNLTFTKGDASTFAVNIPDVSGSAINTGSFATTGSNVFIGDQTITGNGSGGSALNVNGYVNLKNISGNPYTYLQIQATNPGANGGGISIENTGAGSYLFDVGTFRNGFTFRDGAEGNTIFSVITGSTTPVVFERDLVITGSADISGSLSASLQQGYIFVGNASGRTYEVATSSFATAAAFNAYTQSTDNRLTNIEATTSSLLIETQNLELFTASANSRLNNIESKTGSYATTGSNVFTGDQTLVDSEGNSVTLSDASGSLMLVAKGFNSSSAHLVASGSSIVNLIFKDNNNTADTIISGSNNIFPNPAAPTAGFKRYIGSNNLMLNPVAVPQISGSMAFPINVNANIFSHAVTNAMIVRGPVSSSAYDIRGNIVMHGILNIGSSAANNFEKAQAGLTMFGNSVFGGNIVQIANKTVLRNAPVITNNLLFGAIITLNHNSSSISYTSNVQNGGIVVNNNYSPAVGTTAVALSPKVGINTIYGVGHSLTLDGTNTSTSQTKQFYANILAGLFLSASVPTGDSSNVLGVGMIGNSLTITGSSTVVAANAAYTPNNTQGSLFAGRFNAVDGNKAKTAETVFAVGTGTSTNRKTAFLIDSGSNTFVEGTLNVSGSTSLTGSVFGNVVDLNVVSNTASIDLSAANYFTLLLPPTSTTHFNLTNVQPGVTATLVLTTDTNSTASFSSNVKQPSGSLYVPSVSGSTDVLSLSAVTANTVYIKSTYNFI